MGIMNGRLSANDTRLRPINGANAGRETMEVKQLYSYAGKRIEIQDGTVGGRWSREESAFVWEGRQGVFVPQ